MKLNNDNILLSPEDEDLRKNKIFIQWGYAKYVFKFNGKESIKKLHKVIAERMGLVSNMENGMAIDHINRNKLDNRRENLRLVSREINFLNSSRFLHAKGVKFNRRNKKNPFYAYMSINGKGKYLGSAATFEEAHKIYVEARNKRLTELGLPDLVQCNESSPMLHI